LTYTISRVFENSQASHSILDRPLDYTIRPGRWNNVHVVSVRTFSLLALSILAYDHYDSEKSNGSVWDPKYITKEYEMNILLS